MVAKGSGAQTGKPPSKRVAVAAASRSFFERLHCTMLVCQGAGGGGAVLRMHVCHKGKEEGGRRGGRREGRRRGRLEGGVYVRAQ